MRRSTAPNPLRLRVVAATTLLGLLALGCGISDYESRMAGEIIRLQRLDEEVALLGEPVGMPPPGKKDDPTWLIFFRPPKGVSNAPQTGPLHRGIMAVYPGQTGSPIQKIHLANISDRKEPMKEVLQIYSPASEVKRETDTIEGWERKVAVSRYVLEDNSNTLSVNFYPPTNPKVAIVYYVDKGKMDAHAQKTIRLSMSTLGVDAEAGVLWGKYNTAKARAGKK